MAKEYPVIAVIGTEECKKEMEQIQEKLTKQRHIVVPIGMCGKEDLDMRLDKIDLAEELFVVNPAGKIEMNIWTDICYAYLTGKDISSLESMSYREIQEKANDLIYGSEMLAQRQLEMVQHNSYRLRIKMYPLQNSKKACTILETIRPAYYELQPRQ